MYTNHTLLRTMKPINREEPGCNKQISNSRVDTY